MFDKKFFLKLAQILVIGTILSIGIFWLQPGLPIGHDSFAQVTYSQLFFRALSQGQFPVRWTEWVQNGYSHPLFNYYQVGFYYLVALFMAFFPAVLSIKLTVLFLWWLGTGFVYLLTKKLGTLPALMASLVYAFSPYLVLDVFIRASYPEFMAISLLPVCLWIINKIVATPNLNFVPLLTLSFGLSLISHLPAMLIFSPVLICYVLFLLFTKQANLKGLVFVGLGFSLGVGLAMFYLLPAIGEIGFINIESLTELAFNFRRHFANPQSLSSYIWGYNGSWWGAVFDRSALIGLNQSAIILAGLVVLAWLVFKQKLKKNLLLVFSCLIVMYGLFFSFKVSSFFWENLSPLKFVQYPWRFLMVLPIGVSLIAALSLNSLKDSTRKVIVLFLVLLIVIAFNLSFLQPQVYLPENIFNASLDRWDKNPVTREQAFLEPGYMPLGINELPSWGIDKWEVKKGEAIIKPLEIRDHRMSFEVSSTKMSVLQINTHYFPGWQAYLDERKIEIDSRARYKFISVAIPAGQHNLSLKLEDTPLRKTANLTSFFSFILVLGFMIHKLLQFLFDRIIEKLAKTDQRL